MKTSSLHQDLALILAWPDATIRGDEAWMMFFKKIGLVKNLNFKVGHTGIILIERATGELHFYDFGRYIAPRGHGRARSKKSDPRLNIQIKAKIDGYQIINIAEIMHCLENMKDAMQGFGDLYFTVVPNVDFNRAKAFADDWVTRGSYPYGAVAKNNNNCSRFITRLLIHAAQDFHFWHAINFPETIKASPMSNIVNASINKTIQKYSASSGLQTIPMTRLKSLLFLLNKLTSNIKLDLASQLPEDITIGEMVQKEKPSSVPNDAQYLGGVGEGAWFHINPIGNNQAVIKRFTSKGELEYTVLAKAFQAIDFTTPYHIHYDSHLMFSHIIQQERIIRFDHIQILNLGNSEFSSAHKYA